MVLIESEETASVLETPELHRKYTDVRYADCPEDEVMDIYLPEWGEGPFPVIVDIHGGGWYYGAKSSLKIKPVLQGLERGCAVVSLQYTWSVHGHFPIQIYDVKAVIRYLRANAFKYRINPERIGLWGLSAGAHLASLTGTGATVPHLCQMANPENYITKDCPPFFIQHGLADTVVPFQQRRLLKRKSPFNTVQHLLQEQSSSSLFRKWRMRQRRRLEAKCM